MTRTSPSVIDFTPQFSKSECAELIRRYPVKSDNDAMRAGQELKGGNLSRSNLEVIFTWKTKGRGIGRLAKNSDEEISDALRLATQARTTRAAVSVLCGLNGVDVPVASAILTVFDPERFTVIDFRALEALGVESKDRTVNFYVKYQGACHFLAKAYGVSLRNLDRALWHWSKDRSRTRRAKRP
jgi:hypothetical protein